MNRKKMLKKLKQEKKEQRLYSSNSYDDSDIKKFIIILIVLVVAIGLIYGGTELFKKKDSKKEDDKTSINYDILSIGTMLNAPYKDYYVLLYDTDDSNSVLYSTLYSRYKSLSGEDGYKKIFYVDLNDKVNAPYYNINGDDISNPKATKVSELDLGDITLIEVKDKKIVKYVENFDEIKSVLS